MAKYSVNDAPMFFYVIGWNWWKSGSIKKDGKKIGVYYSGDNFTSAQKAAIQNNYGNKAQFGTVQSQYAPEQKNQAVTLFYKAVSSNPSNKIKVPQSAVIPAIQQYVLKHKKPPCPTKPLHVNVLVNGKKVPATARITKSLIEKATKGMVGVQRAANPKPSGLFIPDLDKNDVKHFTTQQLQSLAAYPQHIRSKAAYAEVLKELKKRVAK